MEPDTDWPEAETYLLPGSEAMLAAALALMTGHAQSACERQRTALAHKIRTLLGALSQQASLSLPMRAMVCRLQTHWQALPAEPGQRVHAPAAGWSGQSLASVLT